MKCTLILMGFQRFDEGTKPIKNQFSKKNVLVIMLSIETIREYLNAATMALINGFTFFPLMSI